MEFQVRKLRTGELKHEITGEPIGIAPDGLVQVECLNAIQFCKVLVQKNLLTTDEEDATFNDFRRYELF